MGQCCDPCGTPPRIAPSKLSAASLVVLETLIGPLKSGNAVLAQSYEQLFQQPQTSLFPITKSILRKAAELRASTKLKTPDALHAATAVEVGCTLFITNDGGFRGLSGLSVAVLDDVVKAP